MRLPPFMEIYSFAVVCLLLLFIILTATPVH